MSAISIDNTAQKYGFEQAIGRCLQLTGEVCSDSIMLDITTGNNLSTEDFNTVKKSLEDYLSEHDFF